jgi:leucyl-tRNA synthetase
MAEELWQRLGGAGSIFQETWPRHDPDLALADTITLVVQVNGKVRARLDAPAGLPTAEIEARALADPKIKALLGTTQAVRKVIVVPDKLVNLVVG